MVVSSVRLNLDEDSSDTMTPLYSATGMETKTRDPRRRMHHHGTVSRQTSGAMWPYQYLRAAFGRGALVAINSRWLSRHLSTLG